MSLNKFTKITEEGALFASPFTGESTMLTVRACVPWFQACPPCPFYVQPEESISIQHAIGADIIMQLDDVGSFSPYFCNCFGVPPADFRKYQV